MIIGRQRTFTTNSRLKSYYQFIDMDIDRYTINDVYRQVFISARELQSANIPKQTGAQEYRG